MANEFLGSATYTWMQTMARYATEGLGSPMSATITYTQSASETLNSTTMQVSESVPSSVICSAHRVQIHARPGQQQEPRGQVAFLVERRRLADASPAITLPTRKDRIQYTEGSTTEHYVVRDWALDGARLRYIFYCDRVADQ